MEIKISAKDLASILLTSLAKDNELVTPYDIKLRLPVYNNSKIQFYVEGELKQHEKHDRSSYYYVELKKKMFKD